MTLHTIVLSGQGLPLLPWAFSIGMLTLANRLRKLEGVAVYTFAWNDSNQLRTINSVPNSDRIAVVGFSLGAVQLQWISQNANRQMALGIALDPSRKSPQCRYDSNLRRYVLSAPRFNRIVCYDNPKTLYFGGAMYVGANVTTIEIDMYHLAVASDPNIHTQVDRMIVQERNR